MASNRPLKGNEAESWQGAQGSSAQLRAGKATWRVGLAAILSHLESLSVCRKACRCAHGNLAQKQAASCFQTPHKGVLFPSLPQHKLLPIETSSRKLNLGEKWFQFQAYLLPASPIRAFAPYRFADSLLGCPVPIAFSPYTRIRFCQTQWVKLSTQV